MAIRINCPEQQEGWSCGYRACAAGYFLSRGASYDELANFEFDGVELAQWLLKSFEDRRISKPPSHLAPLGVKRIASTKAFGLWWRVNITALRVTKHANQEP